MCVSWAPDGPYWGRGPFLGPPQLVFGQNDLTGIFPLAGVSQPPPRLRLDCRADPSLTPDGPHLQGVLIQGWGRGRSNAPGTSPMVESAYATGRNLSDARCRARLSDFWISIPLGLMIPVLRTWRQMPHTTRVATSILSS